MENHQLPSDDMDSPRDSGSVEAQVTERLDSLLGIDMVDQDELERDIITKVRFDSTSYSTLSVHSIHRFRRRPSS